MCPTRTGLVPRGHRAIGWLAAWHRQGGLLCNLGELESLQDHTPAGQGAPQNVSSSLGPKAEPWDAALNPHPALPALPQPSVEEPVVQPGLTIAGAGRGFLLGSAWTAKELLEKSQEGCYSGMLAHMAGGHHTGCPPGLQPYTSPDGICLAPWRRDAFPGRRRGD